MSIEAETSTFLQSCKLHSHDKTMRGYFNGTITTGGMPDNPTPEQVIYYRKKPTLSKRELQLTINLLGLNGGRPYVDARLSRFAAETEIDWSGGTRPDGSESTGRLQQTHAFPYLGRINSKINQHVFNKEPVREGSDEDILKDITRDGRSINDIMREVSSYLLATKWCWIGVDAPMRKEDGEEFSIAEKEALKIRPYWQVYSPLDVLDWFFDEQGNLEWIKTQHLKYDDSNPATRPEPVRVVKLWEKGLVTEYTARKVRGKEVIEAEQFQLTLSDRIPFVLVGEISDKPTAFDDLESINRTIMDLGSVDRANFYNTNYPQLVLPSSVIQNAINSNYATSATEAGKLIVGFKNPILVDKDDVTPSYLMPDSGGMGLLGERISTLRREMFEVVGLALENDSRQVESAEAKAWDFLDVAAVMKARAETLEDAERKAVAISKAWDAEFDEWEPVYNHDFDIGNFKDEISALVMAGNMPVPASVSREVVKKLVDRLDRIGAPIDKETKTIILEELNSWNPDDFGGFGAPPAI